MKNTAQLVQKFEDTMKPRGQTERILLQKNNNDAESCRYFIDNFPTEELNSSRLAVVRFCMFFFQKIRESNQKSNF
jgi:hypothetical protein